MELTDVWKTLPSDISDKICNSLVHVRHIDSDLKLDLKFGLLDILCSKLDRIYCQEVVDIMVVDIILEILKVRVLYAPDSLTSLIEILWSRMNPDEIIEFHERVQTIFETPL